MYIAFFLKFSHNCLTLQQQLKAQKKLQKMQQKIAAMEAKLANGEEPALAIDSDDTDQEESETELDGLNPLESDDDDATAVDAGNGTGRRVVSLQNQSQLKDVRKDSTHGSADKPTEGQKRSQRLNYCEEESDTDDETVSRTRERHGNDEDGIRQGCSNTGGQDDYLDNAVEPSLEVCPRSPSPPPPLTQGTMQRYASKTPLQETLQNVTKLADQYKSGSSGSAKSQKRLSDRLKGRQSDSDSSEGGSVGSDRSRRKRVSRKLHQRRVRESDSSDEDVNRSESQRRNAKRRIRSDSDSDEEQTSVRKSARSSKNSTPRSSGGNSGNRSDIGQKSMNVSQDETMDHDRTQLTRVDDKSQQNDTRLLSKDAKSSRALSPHTIENSVPESSKNASQTQNTMKERNTSSNHPSNVQLSTKSPAASVRNSAAETRSPIMEMGCQRSLMQEETAPVVVKNIRKNNGRFSFVATGLSKQELVSLNFIMLIRWIQTQGI